MSQRTTQNLLLKALSPEDFALIQRSFELVDLPVRQSIEPAKGPITHILFLESGVSSVVAEPQNGNRIEVGLIGREGMIGYAVLLGDDRSGADTFIQVAGHGLQIAVDPFRTAVAQSKTLLPFLLRFVNAFLIQTQQTALTNGHFKLEERLARWLLMVHDRVDSDRLDVTHEFLSVMLGVRRPGVTVALHVLEGRGVIRSMRSQVQIVDRKGLEEMANGCYGVPEKEYKRMFG